MDAILGLFDQAVALVTLVAAVMSLFYVLKLRANQGRLHDRMDVMEAEIARLDAQVLSLQASSQDPRRP